jgi:hypothetical protein
LRERVQPVLLDARQFTRHLEDTCRQSWLEGPLGVPRASEVSRQAHCADAPTVAD